MTLRYVLDVEEGLNNLIPELFRPCESDRRAGSNSLHKVRASLIREPQINGAREALLSQSASCTLEPT